LPPRLAEPWSPAGHSLSVVHLISSLTIFTCAPGVIRHPPPLPQGALSSGVVPDSSGPLFYLDKHLHQRAGRSMAASCCPPRKTVQRYRGPRVDHTYRLPPPVALDLGIRQAEGLIVCDHPFSSPCAGKQSLANKPYTASRRGQQR
jgi:hypothetical protein